MNPELAQRESSNALWAVFALMLAFAMFKPLGGHWIGMVLLTGAALFQLWWPMHRAEKYGHGYAFFGLRFDRWRTDLWNVVILCLVIFPAYFIIVHWLFTQGPGMLHAVGGASWLGAWGLTGRLPAGYVLRWPALESFEHWRVALVWFGDRCANHFIGVALPEEAFFRGYLQPYLEVRWPDRYRTWGVSWGFGTLLATFLFALGHVVGEWHRVFRLSTFFPGLLFMGLSKRSGTIVGAILFHGICNMVSEILFTLYQPV